MEQNPTPPDKALDAALARARLVLAAERLWPRLVIFLGAVAIVLGASWLGFWQAVPYYARVFGVVFCVVALAGSAVPMFSLRWPKVRDGLRRLDRLSGAAHRPASALSDTLATDSDPFARALWAAHQQRLREAAQRFKVGLPHPRMEEIDRYAIRALAVLLIIPAFFLAGDERWHRLRTAFDWQPPPAPVTYRIDAWINPPAYTGKAPLLLPTQRSGEERAQGAETYRAPVGSTVIVRVSGNAKVEVQASGALSPDETTPKEGAAERHFRLAGDGTLALSGLPDGALAWRFVALPDRPPTIAFDGPPAVDERNHLSLSYKVEDDYGVAEAQARFTLRERPAEGAHPLYEAPDFSFALPQSRMRSGTGVTTKDLTAHPYAGSVADLRLSAKDEAGQEGVSDPVTIRVPGRFFSQPMARALVEQRRTLAMDARSVPNVFYALELLSLAPEVFRIETSVYLGLRVAMNGLRSARNDDDLRAVADHLWEMALRIEEGDTGDARRDVARAAEALRQALERGASDAEIKQLTERLRQAMDNLMRQLAEQSRRMQGQQQVQRDPNSQTRTLRPQDLRQLLDRIEELSRNGARDQAERLMQELQRMLENLQAGNPQDGQQGQQGQDGLSKLGDMIRKQQQLRDRTFQRGQEQRRRGQPNQQGQQGQQGQQDFNELEGDQRALGETLEEFNRQLGEEGQDSADSQDGQQGQQGQQGQAGKDGAGQQGMAEARKGLRSARRAMREAQEALGRGDGQAAAEAQGRAIRGLQQGGQGLAQMQRGQQQQAGQGEGRGPGQPPGGSRGNDPDRDPLGRSQWQDGRAPPESGALADREKALGAARRAQEVLEELRKRLGEGFRGGEELDYIDRLLRGQQRMQ